MTRSPCWTRTPLPGWAAGPWASSADMVSQFEILPSYTQINYQGRPVRVTPWPTGILIKWFTNRSDGLPAYLIIDMVTQEAEWSAWTRA